MDSATDSATGGATNGTTDGATADGTHEPLELTYEQAREELIETVRRLEAGGMPLEESLRLWQRGEELATLCEDWLEGARARLAEATQAPVEVEDLDENDSSEDS